VDFRDPVNAGIAAVMKENPDLARQVVPDRVHPGPAGHLVMGATLLRAWNAPAIVARVVIDAATGSVTVAENAEVSELKPTEAGLSWTGLDSALPLPLAFEDGETELAERPGGDRGPRSADARRHGPGRRAPRAEGRRGLGRCVHGRRARARREPRPPPDADAVAGLRGQVVGRRRSRGSAPAPRPAGRCGKDPSLRAAAEALAARDEAAQKQRSVDATPQPAVTS